MKFNGKKWVDIKGKRRLKNKWKRTLEKETEKWKDDLERNGGEGSRLSGVVEYCRQPMLHEELEETKERNKEHMCKVKIKENLDLCSASS